MFSDGQVSFPFHRSQMFTEPVPKPSSCFTNIRQSACTASDNVDEATCRV